MPESQSRPVWDDAAPPQEFVPLREEFEADVCVVGAGIAGLTTAYLLAKAGRRVVVLEGHGVGAGMTGMTTAHLASEQDDGFYNVEAMHGLGGSRIAYESHQAAIERIARIVEEEGIDCDFRRVDGYLFLSPTETPDDLRREHEAALRAGFADAELLERVPGVSFDSGPCIRFPRQGRFHPTKYVRGLARAIHSLGGHVFTGTHVEEVRGGADASARTADGRTVRAGHVVVATNSPMNDRLAVHTKQQPYITYVIGAPVEAGAVPDALLWDTGDPYHYVRLQEERGEGGAARWILIVGGEDHHTGEEYDAARYDRLEAWTRERFPIGPVEYRWQGQVFEPIDYLGFIGRDPAGAENVYVATGDSGQGMTHGTIAGMLISDLVLGRENPWATLYDPARKTLRAAKEFVAGQLHVAKHYAEWVTGVPGRVASPDEIPAGSGAVYRRDGKPVAAYRAEDGTLREMSAACTHLGCIVHWNDLDRTWDCPCHGSRYTPEGEVTTGPAPRALRPLDEEGA